MIYFIFFYTVAKFYFALMNSKHSPFSLAGSEGSGTRPAEGRHESSGKGAGLSGSSNEY